MRMLLKAELDLTKTNELMVSGKMGDVVESILGGLKAEAVYFIAENGQRTVLAIVDVKDQTELPAIAEPFFHAFHADISLTPAFTPDEMPKALGAIEEAVKQYG